MNKDKLRINLYLLVAVICGLMLLFFLTSCRSCKCPPAQQTASKDSVRIEHHYEKVTDLVHDTAYITLPPEIQTTVTQDSSRLENTWSVSTARINPDGSLFHDLRTKPVTVPVEYDHPITTITDSQQELHSSSQQQTVIQYKEREYTAWDRFRFRVFNLLLIALGIQIIILVIKYRQPIVKFCKSLIGRITHKWQ